MSFDINEPISLSTSGYTSEIQLMNQLLGEIKRFKQAKSYDTRPLYSPDLDRSYPDKDGCKPFKDAIEARAFIENKLDQVGDGYAVMVTESGQIHACTLPQPNHDLERIPKWLEVGSSGFIRFGSEYWEWIDDNALVWLCPLS